MKKVLQVQCRHFAWVLINSYRTVFQYPNSNPVGTYLIKRYISYIAEREENIPH
jgi:hypothetical protein